jgi:chromosomal replication initiation ATPase DnaA
MMIPVAAALEITIDCRRLPPSAKASLDAALRALPERALSAVPLGIDEPMRVRSLIVAAAGVFGVSVAEITGAGRSMHQVRPRWAVCLLARQLGGRTLHEIGRMLGGRDHTTILHAVRQATTLRARDADFAAKLNATWAAAIEECNA